MARRRAQRLQASTIALLGAALAGCSGTSFGDRLARSFSAAPAPQSPAAESAANQGASPSPPANPAAAAPKPKTAAQPAPEQAKPLPQPRTATVAPAPYRITIKLPSADPSAPAEVVTEALRQAGVPFEVEMIERVNGASTHAAPVVAPAPRAR